MCRVLAISRSGYYAWTHREPSARQKENEALKAKIVEVFDDSRKTYGSPRVHEELKAQDFDVGVNRVARIMREEGICARPKRKFKKTTDSDHEFPIAPNILEREFTVDSPDKVWVADVTYVWTIAGWLYLAVVIDLFSRRVVGWAMADHMRAELVLDALTMALGHRVPHPEGLTHHSDRGSQYASTHHRKMLDDANIECSMSRRGDCWDNAVAESFFSTLKMELIYNAIFLNQESAKTAIAEWIEVFYNRQRRHSSIGYATPVDFETLALEPLNRAQVA